MAIFDSNIFQNPAIGRYLDYTTGINIKDVPFAESNTLTIPLEGRTKPVTDVSEIAPTGSTQSVLAEGIANAALRNQFDFTKPFSTLVRGSGQPNIRDPSQTYDYSGYKLGNPTPGITGMGKEVWEGLKTIYGGHAPNIIANTLGDYTATYTPGVPQLGIEDVMNLYDEYDFKGKIGEGIGSPYNIDVNLPPELLARIKKYHASKKQAQFQEIIQKKEAATKAAAADAAAKRQAPLQALVTAQANREARRRVSQGEARDYGKTETRASSGWESSPFAKGGLVDLYRHGGFSGTP